MAQEERMARVERMTQVERMAQVEYWNPQDFGIPSFPVMSPVADLRPSVSHSSQHSSQYVMADGL